MPEPTLKRGDYGLILAFCLVLYTLVLMAGGPLTMHEGVLSQTSRQMLADRDWVIPHFGQAPWLERPPLPQWITVAIARAIGHCDEEWIVRIGPAFAGTITVLLTAWLGGVLFGRAAGILGALVLATMYQFVRYSTLAEADIFLSPIVAACVCLFAYLELVRQRTSDESINPVGKRPWAMLAFFVLLGMTNLAKGLVFGTAMALVPIGGYLLWNCNLRAILRYVWLWGALAFLLVALAWPVAVYQRYDDVLKLWHFDLFERLHGDYLSEPRWYYFGNWFWVVLPWPAVALWGLGLTARPAFTQRNSPARLVWCWAFLTPLVFTYARSKHHHYMLHFLAPWGILASLALIRLWKKAQAWPRSFKSPLPIAGVMSGLCAALGVTLWLAKIDVPLPGPSWLVPALLICWPAIAALFWWLSFHRRGAVALAGSFALLLMLYWVGFTYKGFYLHRSNDDTAFLREAVRTVPDDLPLLVHAQDEALEGLRVLFYCPDKTILLHNMTYLRDDRLLSSSVYVIARGKELANLRKYGQPSVLLQSKKSRREDPRNPDRWALFHLQLREDLTRKAGGKRISPMQAMYRAAGPSLE